jgi:hypothetical protein
MRSLPIFVLALAACGAGAAEHAPPRTRVATDSSSAGAARDGAARRSQSAPAVVRGLYVNRWATQSPKKMRSLIALADSTEINAFVLDLKDEFGLNYVSKDSSVRRNAGRAGVISDLPALLDTLGAHGILPIARLVVFKDSVAARMNPEHTIRRRDGSAWRDKQGLVWVDPYDPVIREYNIRVAEELAQIGFPEIQYDYIRFPEPYRSLPEQVFPDSKGVAKPEALAEFLKMACDRINGAGARCTADVFGFVTTVHGALEIGQQWEKLSPVVDVLLPMVYPSHYPRGAFGLRRPNAEPYEVISKSIVRARQRDEKLGVAKPEHVRPWLQAFSIGKPKYGALEVSEQKRAVYDAGYDGWVLWHPGSVYEPFRGALERELVTRKKGGATTDTTLVAPGGK